MIKSFFKGASLLAFLMSIPSTASAGAWTAKEGDNYLKGAVNYFSTSNRFGPENGFENFSNTNLNIYWEHGVKDDLTFFCDRVSHIFGKSCQWPRNLWLRHKRY